MKVKIFLVILLVIAGVEILRLKLEAKSLLVGIENMREAAQFYSKAATGFQTAWIQDQAWDLANCAIWKDDSKEPKK